MSFTKQQQEEIKQLALDAIAEASLDHERDVVAERAADIATARGPQVEVEPPTPPGRIFPRHGESA